MLVQPPEKHLLAWLEFRIVQVTSSLKEHPALYQIQGRVALFSICIFPILNLNQNYDFLTPSKKNPPTAELVDVDQM